MRGLQGFVYALADGHRRHDDDKLAPAIALIQLVHRFDVGIGLACAGLHLDGKVDARPGQRGGRLQPIAALDGFHVAQQAGMGQRGYKGLVAETYVGKVKGLL